MSGKSGNKKKKGSSVITALIVLMLAAGICIMAYPTFSDWYNRLHQSRVITGYNQAVDQNSDDENDRLWDDAAAYNKKLGQERLEDGGNADFTLSDEEYEEYEKLLDAAGTGIMGYVDVEKQGIHLPIYHDTSEGVLQVAVGHVAGSSLPVGGNNSHCVLTGHTGLPSSRLFTDIDQMVIGDYFSITVLDHVLTYRVCDIRTVLPTELDTLGIEKGKDLCTLVTCTPYGINTHRLLVTGKRVPTPEADDSLDDTGLVMHHLWRLMPLIIIIAAGVLCVSVVYNYIKRKRKKKKS